MMLERKVPIEFGDWTLYEAQEFDERKAVLYQHDIYSVWCVIEEQVEAGERTYFATIFVDEKEYEENETAINMESHKLIRLINVELMWNVHKLRPVVGGVKEVYTFSDLV